MSWDADKYTADFSFVHQYGSSVIELIDPTRVQTVLDVGCGNGALTKVLHDKGFDVVGMDASEELLSLAKAHYPDIAFMRADATDFQLKQAVDVVFSNAVFHWISKAKQAAMLSCVYAALKKEGQFVFEMGGHGNNQLIHQALAESFAAQGYPYEIPFYFPTLGEYAGLLENAGFSVTYAWHFDRCTELNGEDGLADWIRMFVRTPFSVVRREEQKNAIIDHTMNSLRGTLYKDGKWYADYVRLRMKATK